MKAKSSLSVFCMRCEKERGRERGGGGGEESGGKEVRGIGMVNGDTERKN